MIFNTVGTPAFPGGTSFEDRMSREVGGTATDPGRHDHGLD